MDLPTYLVIDAGNSRIKFGLLMKPSGSGFFEPVYTVSVPHDAQLPWSDLREETASFGNLRHGIIAGGHPAAIERVSSEWPFPETTLHRIDANHRLPIQINVDEPEKVGIDRVLNAVAINEIRSPEKSVVIVDSGTATTVDFVSAEGCFEGGAILPGFELAAKSMNHYTELLPLISIDEISDANAAKEDGIGKNTRQALQQGLRWGIIGSVKELVARQSNQTDVEVYITGGGANLLLPHFENARHEDHLPLHGLLHSFLASDPTQK